MSNTRSGEYFSAISLALSNHADHGVEIPLGGLLVAAETVDVSEHVVGHIHLFVETLLAQFHGELPSQHVGLEHLPLVHLKHDLIAALGIIGVLVALLEQIVLQGLDSREEAHAVAVVESMVHRVAQSQILGLLLIVLISRRSA